jgi:hypothetical protein
LAAVKRTTVQVTTLPLQPDLPKVGNDLLFSAWTDRGLVYIYIWVFLTNSNCIYFNLLMIDNRWTTKTMTNDRPDPSLEGASDWQNSNKHLVMSPRWGSTPRLTDRLPVGRNVILTAGHQFDINTADCPWRLHCIPPPRRLKIKHNI